jgi:type III secretory pathway component EscS
VIIFVIVLKQILKTANVKIVNVLKQVQEKRIKLMNKLFLVLALFVLSACSVGKKCVVTDEGNVISSYVWFYKDKPAELDKINCF